MNYSYEYYIIDTLTGEIAIDPKGINTLEEAFLVLEVLNTGVVEDGLYPNFKLEILPKIKFEGLSVVEDRTY